MSLLMMCDKCRAVQEEITCDFADLSIQECDDDFVLKLHICKDCLATVKHLIWHNGSIAPDATPEETPEERKSNDGE